MMRRSTIALGVLLCAVAGGEIDQVAAQGLTVGVKGGVALSQTHIDADNDTQPLDQRVGLVAGAFVTLPIASWLALQPEGLYVQKGAKADDIGGASTLQLDYVEVPVLAKVGRRGGGGRLGYYAAAGPTVALRVRARSRTTFSGSTEEFDVSDEVSRADVGVAFGGGVEVGRLVVDARYTLGLRNIDETSDDVTVTNRTFAVTVGFRF